MPSNQELKKVLAGKAFVCQLCFLISDMPLLIYAINPKKYIETHKESSQYYVEKKIRGLFKAGVGDIDKNILFSEYGGGRRIKKSVKALREEIKYGDDFYGRKACVIDYEE